MSKKKIIFWLIGFCISGGFILGQETNSRPERSDIVVTATRTKVSISDLPAGIDIIESAAIEKSTALTVGSLLESEAGIDVLGGNLPGARTKVNLRGMTPGYETKRVLLLIDGRRANDQFQGNVELGLIPVRSISRIEILRGPASAIYGSNAMGGVINIVTKQAESGSISSVETVAGSFGSYEFKASHGLKAGNLDYYLDASVFETEGHTDNSDGTDRNWYGSRWDANAGYALSDIDILRVFLGEYQAQGNEESSERDVDRDYQNIVYSRDWLAARFDELNLQIYRTGKRSVYDWKYPGKGIYRQQSIAAEGRQTFWLVDRNKLTFGGDIRKDAVNADDTMGSIDEDMIISGCYLQDEYYLSEQVNIIAGLRRDYNEDYGQQWSPRVGMTLHVRPDSELFVSYNQAHRAPALSDRYVNTEYNGVIFEGNPELEPETLDAYEFGGRYRIGEKGKVFCSVFYSEMDGAFDFMWAQEGIFRIDNVNRSSVYGVESGGEWNFSDFVSLSLGYVYTDGKYDEYPSDEQVEGNTLAYLANDRASMGVSLSQGRQDYSLNVTYTGRRYGDAQNTSENEMDDYVLVSASTTLDFDEVGALTLSIGNIADVSYEEFPGVEEPGRNIRVAYRKKI